MTTAELVQNFLSAEGYKWDIDDDGDIHFKYEGAHIYYTVDEKDPLYFRLIMPNIYQLENNREKVLEVCNSLCSEYKVLKAYLVNDRLWLAVELFIDTTPELEDFFPRSMRLLKSARERAAELIFQ